MCLSKTFVFSSLDYLAYLEKVKLKCLIDSKILEYMNRALERVSVDVNL